jgi:hypothetical protein
MYRVRHARATKQLPPPVSGAAICKPAFEQRSVTIGIFGMKEMLEAIPGLQPVVLHIRWMIYGRSLKKI